MELTIQVIVYFLVIASFAFETWLAILNYKHRKTPIPKEVDDIYDEDRYETWLEYTMEKFRFERVTSTISFIVILLLLSFGLFGVFEEWAQTITGNAGFQILLFMLFYFMISFVIGIFTSYYEQFTIEEKYGFNKTSTKTFVIDKIKSLLLTIVLGGGIIYLLFTLYEQFGVMFIVYGWVAVVVIVLLVNISYVKVFIPLFNTLTPLEDPELKEKIESFAESVGYEISKISVMDASKRSTKLNAFFSGFGRFKQVVLFDTLLEKMSHEEIVSVLAHEIGHNKHKHIIQMLAQTFITLLLYFAALVWILSTPEFSTAFGLDGAHFGFSIIVFGILFTPIGILLDLIMSKLSRKNEFQADKFAATKYQPDSMVTALKVLAKENYSNLTPHPLYVTLKYSHPPIALRIRAIRKETT